LSPTPALLNRSTSRTRRIGILRDSQQLRFEAVRVAIDDQAVAGFGLEPHVLGRLHKAEAVDIEDLAPVGVHASLRIRSQEPMEAGFERIAVPPPAGGETAGPLVHLDEVDLIAAAAGINSRTEAGDPAADDDDLPMAGLHGADSLT
jgi:hypothetical protein